MSRESTIDRGAGRSAARRLSRARGADVLTRALEEQPLARREVVVAAALLCLLAALVLGSYVTRGGYYSDDWVVESLVRFPAHGGILGTLHGFDFVRYRPGLYVYTPLAYKLFGMHMRFFLAWTLLCSIALSTAFYVFLRYFRLGRLEAGAAAALVLVFPYSSSTRLWSGLSIMDITITLYLVGTLIVLRALSGRSQHARLLHVVGFAVVMASVMTYEIVAPAVLLSVLWYLQVTTWRRAVVRWLIDVVAAVAILVFITSGRQQTVGGIGAQLHHVRVMAEQGADLWSRVLVPYGIVPTRLAFGALLVVTAVSAIVALSLPRAAPARRELLRWLAVLGAGFVATAVAYAMFVPADVYYSPGSLGIGDRTNAFAGLGWVVMLVAVARLLAILAFRDLARSRLVIAAAVALALAVVGAGYIDRLRTESDAYAASYHDQQVVLDTMRTTLPRPPHGSTIFLVRNIPWTALGVPVFVQPWDLIGALKLVYNDGTLAGYPIAAPYAVMHCNAGTVSITPAAYGAPVRYGKAFVTDMGTQTTTPLVNRATCLRVSTTAGVAAPVA
jgi:hypothetical protein